MMPVLAILIGVLCIYMGITGRYQQAVAALVTGWSPSASAHA